VVFYGFPIFFKALLEEYDWSAAAASVAFAILQLQGGGMSPVWGWLVGRFGVRPPMLAGTVVMVAGYGVLSRTDSLSLFYLGWALAGLGFAVYWTAPLVAIGNWFRAKRTLAIGLAMSGFGLSGAMAPILNWGIEVYGWRAVFVAAGIGTLALGLPLCLVLRDRPEPYGYSVDDDPDAAAAEEEGEDGPSSGPEFTVAQAIRTRAFWLIAILITLANLAWTGLVPHWAAYLGDAGIASNTVAVGLSGLTVATVIGRVGGGALADRFDKRYVMLAGFFVLSIAVVLFAMVSTPWQMVLFVALAGPAYGSLVPVQPSLAGDYFGTRSYAMILGFLFGFFTIVCFGLPSAVGWVFDHYGTYRPAWWTLAALTFAALPLVWMLRAPDPPAADSERTSA